MAAFLHVLRENFPILEENINDLHNLLDNSQPDKVDYFKSLSKLLYDEVLKSNAIISPKSNVLPKLFIKDFDEEQIWQQLELKNKSAIQNLSKTALNINKRELIFRNIDTQDKNIDDDSENFSDNCSFSGNEKLVFDDDSDSSLELDKIDNKEKKSLKPKIKNSNYKSEVDDQFFKLSKLEEFLNAEDLKEQDQNDKSDEEIDYFQEILSDDYDEDESDIEESENANKKLAKDFMYEDFFDPPDSGDENLHDDEEYQEKMNNINSKEYDIRDYIPEEEPLLSGKDEQNEEQNTVSAKEKYNSSGKTPFELEQEKLKKKIQECEKSLLEPLPWQFTGEVSAEKRPENSLLHQETDFDCNVKQDLVVNSILTEKTEEIIKNAIMNKAWNDVERKLKSTEEQIVYKKEAILEQNKNKKGLAEVYEEDYLKKQFKKDEEEEDPKHKEIKKLMDSLLPELYALFSHIPKPPVPETKVVSNLPAITVEEVAPTAVSDATLLAPEEIKKKSGQIKSSTERTDTDRKRERRKKKLMQKLKKNKDTATTSTKIAKKEKLNVLKKLKQNKNTKIAEVDQQGKVKSSKDFFSRLQDKVSTKSPKTVKEIKSSKSSKKTKKK